MKLLNIALLTFTFSINACAQKIDTNKMETTDKILTTNTSVKSFVANFSNFKMDIQAAGMASIPTATLSENGELYIEYAYNSEGEVRNGKMTLTEKTKTRFDGNWKTIADNGNVYSGSLYFDFKENGEADGFYKFGGSNYKITIFIPKIK